MAMMVAVIMLTVCVLPFAGYESEARDGMFVEGVDRQSTPSGYDFGIYTAEDLAKVGTNTDGWDSDKNYILMNDIDLTGKDLTGNGFDVTVTSTFNGSSITFNVKDANGPLANITVWFDGKSKTTDASGNVMFSSYSSSKDYTVGVSGTDIAFSFELARGTLANVTKNSNGNFAPIAVGGTFIGQFNGNGHVLSGLEIGVFNDSGDAFAGLFWQIYGTVENLGIMNSTVTSISDFGSYAGSIAGNVQANGVINNCYSKANVQSFGKDAFAGGIAGNDEGEITRSFTNGNVWAMGNDTVEAAAGGIAGIVVASGKIELCYSISKVSAQSEVANAGGLAGYAEGNIERSFNNGAVSSSGAAESYAGGVVGYSTVGVTNSYNTGSIISSISTSTGEAYAGGIAGRIFEVEKCYSVSSSLQANAADGNSYVGGVAAVDGGSGSTLEDCYFLKINDVIEIVADDTNWNLNNSDVKEKYLLLNQSTYTGWDFEIWSIDAKYRTMIETETPILVNSGYPVINGLIPNEIYIEEMENQIAVKGDEVTFTVEAKSDIPIRSYSWQKSNDGNSWSTTGDTTQSITVTATNSSVWYRCTVRNGVASALYTDAKLIVYNREIWNLNDLNNIALNPAGKYIQKADLTFGEKDDLNGGHTMNVKTSLNGTQLTVTVKYDVSNEASGVYVVYDNRTWITNAQGIATLDYNSNAGNSIVIGGVIDTADTFVISFELGEGGNTEVERNSNGNFTPIGTSVPFSGEYNGNGYKIYGLEASVYSEDTVNGVNAVSGLFANVTGTVKNVAIESGSSTAMAVNPGSSPGGSMAGGVVGYLNGGTVTGCHNRGSVTAMAFSNSTGTVSSSAGGVVGGSDSGSTISESFNTGSVSSRTFGTGTIAGGVAGSTQDTTVADCYNTGTLTVIGDVSSTSGGVVGIGDGITISNCYSTGKQNVPANVLRGGVIGKGYGDIYNCYYLDTTADRTVASGSGTLTIDGGQTRTDGTQTGAKTSEALRNRATYYSGTTGSIEGWDFDSSDPTWIMTGNGPALKEVIPDGGDGDGDDGLEPWMIAAIIVAVIVVALAAFMLYRRRKAKTP